MKIRCYETHQLDELVAFITRLNHKGAHHIGYFGTHPADIRSTLQVVTPPLEQGFALAFDGEQLVGVLGIDSDTTLGRAWLFGPLLAHDAPPAVADELYRAILPSIPASVYEYELFCDSENALCQDFASWHGFPLHGEAAILSFTRDDLAAVSHMLLPELSPSDHAQFAELHDRLFPRTYASGQQLIEERTAHAKLFTVTEQERLLGYVAAKVDIAAASGYTDYIGVAEDARGQGLGRQLLAAALHWMFSFPEVQHSDLTVMTTNGTAVRLYQSLGFKRERTMRAYRKKVALVHN